MQYAECRVKKPTVFTFIIFIIIKRMIFLCLLHLSPNAGPNVTGKQKSLFRRDPAAFGPTRSLY